MKKIIFVVLISVALIILTGIYVLSGIISPQWWLEKYAARISALGNKYPNNLEIQEGLLFLYNPHFLGHIRYSREEQRERILTLDPNNRAAWAEKAKRACYDYSSDYLYLPEHLSNIMADAKERNAERVKIGDYSPSLKMFYDEQGIEYIEKEQFDNAVEQMLLEFGRRARVPLDIIQTGESVDKENAIYNYYRAHHYCPVKVLENRCKANRFNRL